VPFLYDRFDDAHALLPAEHALLPLNILTSLLCCGEDFLYLEGSDNPAGLLAQWGGEHKGIGPVRWGKDYFHVAPFYWSQAKDWFLLPLAWSVGEDNGAGPVWWGEKYFTLFPIFWKWENKTLLLPLAYNETHEDGHDFRILWRLFRHARAGSEKLVELQPLWSYQSKPEKSRFSVLWRVFVKGKDKEGHYMRLLFSPKIRLGG